MTMFPPHPLELGERVQSEILLQNWENVNLSVCVVVEVFVIRDIGMGWGMPSSYETSCIAALAVGVFMTQPKS